MEIDKRVMDYLMAALRMEERRLRELAEAIELDSVPRQVVMDQVQKVEQGLKRVRQVA
jgi:hypothetical protein